MVTKPLVGTILRIIPTIIKLGIIGVLIWIGYIFIKAKIRSNSVDSNLITNSNMYLRVFGVDIRKRTINKAFLVLGALPLLVYPMAIIANLMMLAALSMGDGNILNTISALLFVAFTSSYLLTYIICFVSYFKKRDENILVSIIPLIHVAAIFLMINLK